LIKHLAITLRSVMKNPVITVDENATLKEVIEKLGFYDIGCVVVIKDSTVKGIISERDIIKILKDNDAKVLEEPVSKYMVHNIVSLSPESTIIEALHIMFSNRIRHLVVSSNGKLEGIVSLRDVAMSLFKTFMTIYSYIIEKC